ncbi:MAG: hypothetical protein VB050_11850 [Geobacteraceae bacterium]|nr:hypothetical protein [Geobacteraceae bacterium]
MFKLISHVIIASFLFISVHGNSEELDAVQVLKEIKQKGANSVIIEYWTRENGLKWQQIERSISNGTKEWLDVAKLLRAESDAGVTEGLYFSLSMALKKNPAGVLSLIKSQPDLFPINWICRDPYYDGTDLSTEERFLKETEKVLANFHDPNGDKDVDFLLCRCLENIQAGLRTLEKENHRSEVQGIPAKTFPATLP